MADLNVRQTAAILGVHENTVRNMAKDGRLPYYRIRPGGYRRFKAEDVAQLKRTLTPTPSYHDLHITTAENTRTSIFDLSFGLQVTCSRVGGWELWDHNRFAPRSPRSSRRPGPLLVAGEYAGGEHQWLILDVAGHVIVDSKNSREGSR